MHVSDLFRDEALVQKIQSRLPEFFYLAELESSRAGKVGMEVGSIREKVVIALLIHKFGPENVETNLPITEPEVDVLVFSNPVSIKTHTGSKLTGIKLIWTVDTEQALKFGHTYLPQCDMLLVQVNWGKTGGLLYFPRAIQIDTLQELGRERYLRLPKPGTNPRGVEISPEALNILAQHPQALRVEIEWLRSLVEFDPYARWLELWQRN